MAALTELVADVRASVPSIPSFVAERQLLRATRSFCQETRAWRVDFKMSTVGGVATIELSASLPENTELVDIITVKNVGGGEPLSPRSYKWLDTNFTDWRSDTALDAKYYVLDGNNVVRLIPTPADTVASLYDIRLAVKPTRDATELDDVLVNKYDEVLINGALSHLYLMPKKPWTDLGLAQFHLAAFLNAIPGARAEASEEFQVGVPRKVKYGGL